MNGTDLDQNKTTLTQKFFFNKEILSITVAVISTALIIGGVFYFGTANSRKMSGEVIMNLQNQLGTCTNNQNDCQNINQSSEDSSKSNSEEGGNFSITDNSIHDNSENCKQFYYPFDFENDNFLKYTNKKAREFIISKGNEYSYLKLCVAGWGTDPDYYRTNQFVLAGRDDDWINTIGYSFESGYHTRDTLQTVEAQAWSSGDIAVCSLDGFLLNNLVYSCGGITPGEKWEAIYLFNIDNGDNEKIYDCTTDYKTDDPSYKKVECKIDKFDLNKEN